MPLACSGISQVELDEDSEQEESRAILTEVAHPGGSLTIQSKPTLISQTGAFRLTWASEPEILKVNQYAELLLDFDPTEFQFGTPHQWTVRYQIRPEAERRAVSVPNLVTVGKLGHASIQGLVFQEPGWYRINFEVENDTGPDSVEFRFQVRH